MHVRNETQRKKNSVWELTGFDSRSVTSIKASAQAQYCEDLLKRPKKKRYVILIKRIDTVNYFSNKFLFLASAALIVSGSYISWAWFLCRNWTTAMIDVKGSYLIDRLTWQTGFAAAFMKTLHIKIYMGQWCPIPIMRSKEQGRK